MAFDKYKTALENAEHDVVRMVMDISEKVIYDRLSDRQETIVQLVKNAMHKASLEETLTLKVSPVDYEYLKRHQELIFEEHQLSNQASMVQDATLTTGSCGIETATGTMDASVGTVLKNIDESFSDLSPRIAG
jgi:flagellar assembly protein FliH